MTELISGNSSYLFERLVSFPKQVFPLRIRTFDDFIEAAVIGSSPNIEAKADIKFNGLTFEYTGKGDLIFSFSLKATFPSRRAITYQEIGSVIPCTDSLESQAQALKHDFKLIDERLDAVKARLPEAAATFINRNSRRFNRLLDSLSK